MHCNSEEDAKMEEEYTAKIRAALKAANYTDSSGSYRVETVGVKDYECSLSPSPPTNIYNLSPNYVNVVAALGDSVTAGFGAGAKSIFDALKEYRGLSWSIGGDEDLSTVATLPNILRHFNPEVKGFSTGVGKSNAKLNVAVSGAVCWNMLDQAKTLVAKMEAEGVTADDWKVITMWIGGNDFCAIKDDGSQPDQLAEGYVEEVKKALDYLHDQVPRAFVNMVLMINISDLSEVKGIECLLVHEFACKSIQSGDSMRQKVKQSCELYNEKLRALINGGQRYDKEDFTVVLQPFFTETAVPRKDGSADKTYFGYDCFHFSQKGHAVGAIYLWNNMFEAVGQKTDRVNWDDIATPDCPKENPYFATYKSKGEDSP